MFLSLNSDINKMETQKHRGLGNNSLGTGSIAGVLCRFGICTPSKVYEPCINVGLRKQLKAHAYPNRTHSWYPAEETQTQPHQLWAMPLWLQLVGFGLQAQPWLAGLPAAPAQSGCQRGFRPPETWPAQHCAPRIPHTHPPAQRSGSQRSSTGLG